MAVVTYPDRPPKLMTFSCSGRPVYVVIPAREDHDHRAGRQRRRRVVARRADHSGALEKFSRRPGEQRVVPERVERTLVAVGVVIGNGEHRHVGSYEAAGMIRDHQRRAGRDILQAPHL